MKTGPPQSPQRLATRPTGTRHRADDRLKQLSAALQGRRQSGVIRTCDTPHVLYSRGGRRAAPIAGNLCAAGQNVYVRVPPSAGGAASSASAARLA